MNKVDSIICIQIVQSVSIVPSGNYVLYLTAILSSFITLPPIDYSPTAYKFDKCIDYLIDQYINDCLEKISITCFRHLFHIVPLHALIAYKLIEISAAIVKRPYKRENCLSFWNFQGWPMWNVIIRISRSRNNFVYCMDAEIWYTLRN